jgi:hypothetical protein
MKMSKNLVTLLLKEFILKNENAKIIKGLHGNASIVATISLKVSKEKLLY